MSRPVFTKNPIPFIKVGDDPVCIPGDTIMLSEGLTSKFENTHRTGVVTGIDYYRDSTRVTIQTKSRLWTLDRNALTECGRMNFRPGAFEVLVGDQILTLGDDIDVPPPREDRDTEEFDDDWRNDFRGMITAINHRADDSFITVRDMDDVSYLIPLSRLRDPDFSELNTIYNFDLEPVKVHDGEYLTEDNGAHLVCNICMEEVRSNELHRCPGTPLEEEPPE